MVATGRGREEPRIGNLLGGEAKIGWLAAGRGRGKLQRCRHPPFKPDNQHMKFAGFFLSIQFTVVVASRNACTTHKKYFEGVMVNFVSPFLAQFQSSERPASASTWAASRPFSAATSPIHLQSTSSALSHSS